MSMTGRRPLLSSRLSSGSNQPKSHLMQRRGKESEERKGGGGGDEGETWGRRLRLEQREWAMLGQKNLIRNLLFGPNGHSIRLDVVCLRPSIVSMIEKC